MQRITKLALMISLATLVVPGCGLDLTSPDHEMTRATQAREPYVPPTPVVDDEGTEVDAADYSTLGWAKKHAEANAKLDLSQEENRLLADKVRQLEQQVAKLNADFTRAEKELGEANSMLLEMREELQGWKTNVLGFRDEIRRSQKAELNALAKIMRLLGGEMAPPSPAATPTTRPAEQETTSAKEQANATRP